METQCKMRKEAGHRQLSRRPVVLGKISIRLFGGCSELWQWKPARMRGSHRRWVCRQARAERVTERSPEREAAERESARQDPQGLRATTPSRRAPGHRGGSAGSATSIRSAQAAPAASACGNQACPARFLVDIADTKHHASGRVHVMALGTAPTTNDARWAFPSLPWDHQIAAKTTRLQPLRPPPMHAL